MDRSGNERKHGGGPSKLELLILRSIQDGESAEDIARAAKIPPAALGKEIALLQIRGLIAPDGRLTEKGLEAAKS
jgi:hypothetical protein